MENKFKIKDYLAMIFSDMVYEDFGKNGEEVSNKFYEKDLEYIFNELPFKDSKIREKRFKKIYTKYADLKKWGLLWQDGENVLVKNEKKDNKKLKWEKPITSNPFVNKLIDIAPYLTCLPKVIESIGGIISIVEKAIVNQAYKKGIESLENVGSDVGFYGVSFVNEEDKEIIISFRGTNQNVEDHLLTNSLIAAGIPSKQFQQAKESFEKIIKKIENDGKNYKDYKFIFTGHSLGGGLAQYAAVMAEGIVDCKAIGWNGIGIEHFQYFNGNEFLGYKDSLLVLINNILKGEKNQREKEKIELYEKIKSSNIISGNQLNKSIIDYKEDGTPKVNKNKFLEKLYGVKKVIIVPNGETVLTDEETLVFYEKDLEKFDFTIVDRKLEFNYRYKMYKAKGKNQIVTYVNPYDITGRLLKHIGTCILLTDKNGILASNENGLDKIMIENAKKSIKEGKEKIKEYDLLVGQQHDLDVFYPFIKMTEEGHDKNAKNRFGEIAEIGDISDKINYDYLRAVIKNIMIESNKHDKNLITRSFINYIRMGKSPNNIRDILLGKLQHSMGLQERLLKKYIYEKDNIFEFDNDYIAKEYFTESDRILEAKILSIKDKRYKLDNSILEQLKRMPVLELKKLWDWEISSECINLLLGTKGAVGEDLIDYSLSEDEDFTNEEFKLAIEFKGDSLNTIYGSLKNTKNYELDTEYIKEDIYEFKSGKGVGTQIISKNTNSKKSIKIDGVDISGTYQELDEMRGTLINKFYGENIILKNNRTLRYLYGPKRKDELIIEGFQNGDYGINLEDKVIESETVVEKLSYTEHKIRIDLFEFTNFDKFEIKKEIYEHSIVKIKGSIREEDADKYRDYLKEDEVKIVITYMDDDTKILFKGIIENYELSSDLALNNYLEFEAISYSKKLEQVKNNRVYQNLGTIYEEVLQMIMDKNEGYFINFYDNSMGKSPLLSEEYPVIIQYKESEWDFLKRICSYIKQVLLVDDTKDDSESMNIQFGYFESKVKELNNKKGSMKRSVNKDVTYKYFKIKKHEHYLSDDIFDIGKLVKYRVHDKAGTVEELLVIKNKIYIDGGALFSDFILVKKEDIDIKKEKRIKEIEGRSFRAEVLKVDKSHKAQVKFLDIEDNCDEAKAFLFPIDRTYEGTYFAPEIGDVVDIYFKGKNEKHATIKSTSTDNNKEIDQDPNVKVIRTAFNKEVKFDEEAITITGKDEEFYMRIKENSVELISGDKSMTMFEDLLSIKSLERLVELSNEEINLVSGDSSVGMKEKEIIMANGTSIVNMKDGKLSIESDGNNIKMDKNGLEMKGKKGTVTMTAAKTELAHGSSKVQITASGINLA